jgi:hypothetical protein
MAHDVFISYSSKDKTVADAVCVKLESQKIRCWIAPRDMPPGQSWAATIIEAISESKVFVLVFSDGSNKSGQVAREVGEAVDSGIPIVPLRIEDVELSREMRYYIKSIHWLDALTPPIERHLQKISESVQALLSIEGEEQPSPLVETIIEAPVKKRWPLPTWATTLLAMTAVLILGGVGTWAISKINSATVRTISTDVSTGEIEESLADLTPTSDSGSDWRPVSFQFPSPQIWDITGENQYTAIDQRNSDAYAWSTISYQGDMMVSLELRSTVEALDLSWEEMQRQIPSQNSGCVILYGDGTMHSYGSLVFCVDWDGYFIDKHYRTYDEEFLAYFLHDNPSETVYTLMVEVIDDMASMYVNGEKVLSTFFDPEEISPNGRIGLFKYWIDGEITFSNIQVKTSPGTEH